MSINDKLFRAPATKGEVAGIAIDCVLALYAVLDALEAVRTQGDVSRPVGEIRDAIKRLDGHFEQLTGWKPEP